MIFGLGRINAWIERACCAGIVVILAAISGIVLMQVVCRYGFNRALPWPEEVAKGLMVWMALLAAPVGYRRQEHVGITLLQHALGPRGRVGLLVALDGAVLLMALGLGMVSWPVVQVGTLTRASSVDVPMACMYVAFPVSMGLLALAALESLGRRRGADPEVSGSGL